MDKIIITRFQFNKLKEIFEQYDVDHVLWTEDNLTGIGPNISVEFDPKTSIKVDVTDVGSW